ncbi:threonine/serine exporter family protein [Nocardia sp. NPDC052316]|uniref:threonine/serine exporter family protein n=1 Tax=Nocardia sp. NPDC052316 TaxID=3364329 RepID=UPI0037C8398D
MTTVPPAPADVLDLLRRVAVALIRSVETTSRVTEIVTHLAHRYGYDDVRVIVVPTSVVVRVVDGGGVVHVDLLDTDASMLRLDQIDTLYRLIDRVKRKLPAPAIAVAELSRVLDSAQPTPMWQLLLGNVVLTVGMGMTLNPSPRALPGYVVLGLVVQVLISAVGQLPRLSFALPVLATATVTMLAFGLSGPLSGGHPAELLVPPVAALLPGSVLTTGVRELAEGAMISGAARVASGVNVLLLLGFGILVGLEIIGKASIADPAPYPALGWWAPVVGVALIGLGMSWQYSAPTGSIPWMLFVLYLTYAAQALGSRAGSLFGVFLGGLTLAPAAMLIASHRDAPAVQASFLLGFRMLVPGSLGLTGLSDLAGHETSLGIHVLATTLLTMIAIALGIQVGSGLFTSPVWSQHISRLHNHVPERWQRTVRRCTRRISRSHILFEASHNSHPYRKDPR